MESENQEEDIQEMESENQEEDILEIPFNSPHQQLKPGQKRINQSRERQTKTQRQAKSRCIKRLSVVTDKLSSYTFEPVEVLCVIKEIKSSKYKYMGFGELMKKFQQGIALTEGKPKKKKNYTGLFPCEKKETEELTPLKYKYTFASGAGQNIATRQKEKLQNVETKTAGKVVVRDISTTDKKACKRKLHVPNVKINEHAENKSRKRSTASNREKKKKPCETKRKYPVSSRSGPDDDKVRIISNPSDDEFLRNNTAVMEADTDLESLNEFVDDGQNEYRMGEQDENMAQNNYRLNDFLQISMTDNRHKELSTLTPNNQSELIDGGQNEYRVREQQDENMAQNNYRLNDFLQISMTDNRHKELSTVTQNNQSELIDGGQNEYRVGEQQDENMAQNNYRLNDFLQISMTDNRHKELSTLTQTNQSELIDGGQNEYRVREQQDENMAQNNYRLNDILQISMTDNRHKELSTLTQTNQSELIDGGQNEYRVREQQDENMAQNNYRLNDFLQMSMTDNRHKELSTLTQTNQSELIDGGQNEYRVREQQDENMAQKNYRQNDFLQISMTDNRQKELSTLKMQHVNECVTVIQTNQSELIDGGQNEYRVGEQQDENMAQNNYRLNDFLQISMTDNRHKELSTLTQNNQTELINGGQNEYRVGEQQDENMAQNNYRLNDFLQISMTDNRHKELSTLTQNNQSELIDGGQNEYRVREQQDENMAQNNYRLNDFLQISMTDNRHKELSTLTQNNQSELIDDGQNEYRVREQQDENMAQKNYRLNDILHISMNNNKSGHVSKMNEGKSEMRLDKLDENSNMLQSTREEAKQEPGKGEQQINSWDSQSHKLQDKTAEANFSGMLEQLRLEKKRKKQIKSIQVVDSGADVREVQKRTPDSSGTTTMIGVKRTSMDLRETGAGIEVVPRTETGHAGTVERKDEGGEGVGVEIEREKVFDSGADVGEVQKRTPDSSNTTTMIGVQRTSMDLRETGAGISVVPRTETGHAGTVEREDEGGEGVGVEIEREKNEQISIGDYVLVRYEGKKGKTVYERKFAGKVIDYGVESDWIISFFKNTDKENLKKIANVPEECSVPREQIIKKISPPEEVMKKRALLYEFKL